ncbi:phospholipase D family protein [Altererythrobacter sp. B11]|uniref:phospholipase D family protein n=1 Tax=Altererythrobacter sp. B11 TaxID=2060312 RepID=UPI000DC6E26A|nr:phospholipase D family protein [Altererythrobacter sp. B11]BBC73964.1 phospholipase D family protein [Altererythrobacter sp. B11]
MKRTEDTGSKQPDMSSHCLLHDAKDAFAARLWLIRSARRSLDVQYYIWHNDMSGSLLLDEIAAAAQRGVAVRLLIDDNGIDGLDGRLAILDALPMVAVRLYNPFRMRRFRALEWLLAFHRLNSRMHAKSLTADEHMTIVGGRNIGDEYFGAQSKAQFEDLDVLTAGPVVAEVKQVFDQHWHSAAVRPVADVVGRLSRKAKCDTMRKAEAIAQGPAAQRYLEAIEAQPLYTDLRLDRAKWFRAPTRAIAAMPLPETTTSPDRATGLNELLPQTLPHPANDLVLISGYFVPTEQGCDELGDLRRSGVSVRVLTNSYASTDVGVVHAGYAPFRKVLLQHGIELFEIPAPDDAPKKRAAKFLRSGSERSRRFSGKSLHAKVYVVDRRYFYIGSANFDPRSAHLNTELGFIIESAALSEQLANAFERAAHNSYRMSLLPDGALAWTDTRDDQPVPERIEPGTNPISRAMVRLLAKLPIDRHL